MASAELSQRVQITTPDLRAMSQPAQMDPDISATLSDFLTYTEHLPSAIQRSLTLIEGQDRLASDLQQQIHELLTTYSRLPTLKDEEKPDVEALRRDVSRAQARMEKARRMAAAEGARMAEMVTKDRARLDYVTQKLKAMPMPPSRDPTPEPLTSPQLKKVQPVSEKRAAHRTGTAPRVRGRKIMVPGEVLPPPNPDSPPPSEPSDWESPPRSPAPVRRERQKSIGRQRTPKPPKVRKDPQDRTPRAPRVRAPGQPGTNVHSAVAGISTSNALLALVPPPDDAPNGSKWKPWKKLTEHELAKLRKRMKKNAIWIPSSAMRNRELKTLGRGVSNMELARDNAKLTGVPFIDEYTADWVDPTQAVVSGEERAEMTAMLGPEADGGDGDEALMNRGMRLNEAKKRKRERQLEEQAIQAQLAAENGGTLQMKDETMDDPKSPQKPKAVEIVQKKRKREATPPLSDSANIASADTSDPLGKPAPPAKRLKITIPAVTKTEPATAPDSNATVLADPSTLSPAVLASNAKSPGPRSRHGSSAPEGTLVPRKSSTKITIKPSKAASAEPPVRRVSLRRGSNASLPGNGKPASPAPEAPVQIGRNGRRKRPAPGLVTTEEDGSAKVIVGKRKAAPRKKNNKKEDGKDAQPAPTSAVEPEEYIDPNEARYCVCGDVSWGTMIACDNDDCEKEWFHLDCVDLKEMPPRRTKWYCPDCRKKLKLGQNTNGIVKS